MTHESFFNQVPLPGNRGKGGPWCSAAGTFVSHGHRFVIGLIMQSQQPNNLGQIAIANETQWLDALRVGQQSDATGSK